MQNSISKNISDSVLYLVPSLYRKVSFIESGEGTGAGVSNGFLFRRIGSWASRRDIDRRVGFCLFFLEVHLVISWSYHLYLDSLLCYFLLLASLDNFSVDDDGSLV